MNSEHTQTIHQYITDFIRQSTKNEMCCGISYIVDGHEDIEVTEWTFGNFGSALTIHVESHVHCPVCEKVETMMIQFRVADNRLDIVHE